MDTCTCSLTPWATPLLKTVQMRAQTTMQTLREQSSGPITPTMPLLPSWTSLQLQGGGEAVVQAVVQLQGGGEAVVGREEEGGEGEGEDRSEGEGELHVVPFLCLRWLHAELGYKYLVKS
jgi:hypothetical protein